MALIVRIHPDNPQPRLIRQVADALRDGEVIVYPTDSGYALGCHLNDKDAVAHIRQIRGMDDKHLLTLVCRDLSELATYARVDNNVFRLMKNNTPGSYTFILEATKEVPRRLQHPKRSTVGVRIPDHPIALALLEEMNEPLLSASLILPDAHHPLTDADEIDDLLGRQVDMIVEGGAVGLEPTTVIDLSTGTPELLRRGKGDPAPFGLED
jgi:tRNA threonylcarbamoyl adenosine modification protein (Sua5/YciO/YrdC/YwlC family)